MSSIIDALKKSDANRPRKNHGMKMNLNLGQPVKSKRHYVVIIIALFMVTMVAASWYLKRPYFIWQTVGSLTPTTDAPTTKVTSTATKLVKPEPAKAQIKAQQPRSKNRLIDKDATANTSQTEPSPEGSSAVSSNPNSVEIMADEGIETIDLSGLNQLSESRTVNEQQTSDPNVIAETKIIDEQLSEIPMKNKQAIDKPSADTKTNTIPQLYELPFAIRKDLPKLNLSVHIYDPIIENRMAILNGLSVHVGDTYEELLTIKNITQEGVVITVQNRDFIILK